MDVAENVDPEAKDEARKYLDGLFEAIEADMRRCWDDYREKAKNAGFSIAPDGRPVRYRCRE